MRNLGMAAMAVALLVGSAPVVRAQNVNHPHPHPRVTPRERHELRSDKREIRQDSRELRGDTHEIRQDRREIRQDTLGIATVTGAIAGRTLVTSAEIGATRVSRNEAATLGGNHRGGCRFLEQPPRRVYVARLGAHVADREPQDVPAVQLRMRQIRGA